MTLGNEMEAPDEIGRKYKVLGWRYYADHEYFYETLDAAIIATYFDDKYEQSYPTTIVCPNGRVIERDELESMWLDLKEDEDDG